MALVMYNISGSGNFWPNGFVVSTCRRPCSRTAISAPKVLEFTLWNRRQFLGVLSLSPGRGKSCDWLAGRSWCFALGKTCSKFLMGTLSILYPSLAFLVTKSIVVVDKMEDGTENGRKKELTTPYNFVWQCIHQPVYL